MAAAFQWGDNASAGNGFIWVDNRNAGNPLPTISSVAVAGGVVTIIGANFGGAQLSGSVNLSQAGVSLGAAILTWSDAEITLTEPSIESSALSFGTTDVVVANDIGDSVVSSVAFSPAAPREAIDVVGYDSNEAGSLGFLVGGSDRLPVDGDQLAYDPQLFAVGGVSVADFTVSLNADLTYLITGTGDLAVGNYEFRNVRAYDSALNSWGSLGVVGVEVAEPSANTPPVVTAPIDTPMLFVNGAGGLALDDAQLVALFATATVVDDSDTLTVSPDLSAFTGSIPAGVHTIQFNSTADSEGLTGSDTMLLTVTEAAAGNSAPSITSTNTVAVTVGVSVNHTVTTNDIDGDALTIVAVGTWPAGYALVDNGNGTATVTIVALSAGAQNITVRVSDGSLSDEQVITVNASAVVVVDSPPVFTSNPITSVIIGDQYSYTPTATDADGDSVVFTVPVIPNWMTFSGGALSGDSVGVSPGNYSVQVVCTANGVAVPQSFTVTVSESNFSYPEDRVFKFASAVAPKLVVGDTYRGRGTFWAGVPNVIYGVGSADSISAAIISADHTKRYCEPVIQNQGAAGSDWANAIIVVSLPKEITAQISAYVKGKETAKVEIQVTIGGEDYTWFAPVLLIPGHIG